MEHEPRDEAAEATSMDPPIRRLEDDRQRSIVNCTRAPEERRERIVLRGQLLPSEENEPDVVRTRVSGREIAHELDCDSEAALHVARAEPVHRVVPDLSRKVSLCRHGVVVTDENDERDGASVSRSEEKDFVA